MFNKFHEWKARRRERSKLIKEIKSKIREEQTLSYPNIYVIGDDDYYYYRRHQYPYYTVLGGSILAVVLTSMGILLFLLILV